MQFIQLKEKLKAFTIFSLPEIRKVERGFDRRRLNEWQKKGYLKKIIKNYYIFSDLDVNERVLFEIANRIYPPSYVSLEMALAYYGLIPEGVYAVTSVTTRRTYKFNTTAATFIYRTVKPALYFGYQLVSYKEKKIFKLANLEKAILDYLYINPHIRAGDDFESLRINKDTLSRKLNQTQFMTYAKRFNHKALLKRAIKFLEFMKNA